MKKDQKSNSTLKSPHSKYLIILVNTLEVNNIISERYRIM